MRKRVLLIGGNFYPEPTGIGKYNGEMIDYLASQGYQCTVITSFPYYPQWKVQEPYAKDSNWYKRETKPGSGYTGMPIEIIRCPLYIPGTPTGSKRILSDVSFCLSALFMLILIMFRKKYDLVIAVVPPFQLGLLAILYKRIKGAKFLYHIQDLQIDAARDLNMIKSPLLIKMLLRVERYILKNADLVSSVSSGMIKRIVHKYKRPIVFFPNWVDTTRFYPLPEKAKLKEEFNFRTSDKIVLYSGAIGEKQGLEVIMHVAQSLKHHADLKFVICGSGPYLKKLEDLKQERKLSNVIFLPLQSTENLNRFLNMADIHLVLQKATASDLVMPSKLTTILSVGGVAIVTAIEGSCLYEIVSSNEMGILINPEDPKALTEAINYTFNHDNSRINLNARSYAEQFLAIEKIFRSFSVHMN